MRSPLAPSTLLLVFGFGLSACAGVDNGGDAAERDAGRDDAGARDSGGLDAGARDGGAVDAGAVDAGARDGGPRDAGRRDGGPRDAGPRDGGAYDGGPRDAGASDTGVRDAGFRDGGPRDAGAPDAGFRDGGPPDVGFIDAGFRDGGPPPHDGGPPPHDGGGQPDAGAPDAGLVTFPVTLIGPWDAYWVNTGSVVQNCPMPQMGATVCTLEVEAGSWLDVYGQFQGHCYSDFVYVQCGQTSANYCTAPGSPSADKICTSVGVDRPLTFVRSVNYDGAISLCGGSPMMCLPTQTCGFHGTAYCGDCPTPGDLCIQYDYSGNTCVTPPSCP
ncbi:MAG: hypothetical protein RIT81_44780 [Deltaproteobacteria bacterium]